MLAWTVSAAQTHSRTTRPAPMGASLVAVRVQQEQHAVCRRASAQHLGPERGHAEVAEVAEQRHALVTRGIMEGDLDDALPLLHAAADAAEQVESKPAPPAVACARQPPWAYQGLSSGSDSCQ